MKLKLCGMGVSIRFFDKNQSKERTYNEQRVQCSEEVRFYQDPSREKKQICGIMNSNNLFTNNLGVNSSLSSENIRVHLVQIKMLPDVMSGIVFRFDGGGIVVAICMRRHFITNMKGK